MRSGKPAFRQIDQDRGKEEDKYSVKVSRVFEMVLVSPLSVTQFLPKSVFLFMSSNYKRFQSQGNLPLDIPEGRNMGPYSHECSLNSSNGEQEDTVVALTVMLGLLNIMLLNTSRI